MGILRVEGLHKAFGVEILFDGVSFELARGEKMGLVGANGTGKTTLMRCLLGHESIDCGQIGLPSGETLAYVEQDSVLANHTLYEELCSAYRDVIGWQKRMGELEAAIATAQGETLETVMKEYAQVSDRFERGGGYGYENIVRRVAFGLGFSEDDFSRNLETFSGGQKTRIALARALIRQPDFLFLDEPTNHLDIAMVEWLEDFLKSYSGGVLIISHDRYFLDEVTDRIGELENQRFTLYKGNYSAYAEQKELQLASLTSAYEKQQAKIAKTEEFIRRYKNGVKFKQARGREKQLNRLERIVLPANQARFDFFGFHPPGECAERVAELTEAGVAYGGRSVFSDVSLLIRRGDGVALVGPNGVGKTTLLKLLTGDKEPSAGRVKIGSRVKIGYFSQEHETLNPKLRVIEEIMQDFGVGDAQARHYLAAFLFRGDDVLKMVGDLSGGEKARLAMLKLMLTGANFLILDEPTNHLDIPAKEAVEEAISAFPGTFLAVSHDRYFLDRVANCVVELTPDGLTEYGGNYSYYKEKKAAAKAAAPVVEKTADQSKAVKQAERPSQQRRKRQLDAKQKQRLEEEIAMLEYELAAFEQRLSDPANHADPGRSRELAEEYANTKTMLDEKYLTWMEYSEE